MGGSLIDYLIKQPKKPIFLNFIVFAFHIHTHTPNTITIVLILLALHIPHKNIIGKSMVFIHLSIYRLDR